MKKWWKKLAASSSRSPVKELQTMSRGRSLLSLTGQDFTNDGFPDVFIDAMSSNAAGHCVSMFFNFVHDQIVHCVLCVINHYN